MPDTPDIEPQRMSATDVASLAPIETYAILVTLAGDPDPVVTQALIDATRRVLVRTRGRLPDRPPGWDQLSTGTSPSRVSFYSASRRVGDGLTSARLM
jgi:hypothetical protein